MQTDTCVKVNTKPKKSLHNRFTEKELRLMTVIFDLKFRASDKYVHGCPRDCCPLDLAIREWAWHDRKRVIEALIYLGFLTEDGKIVDPENNGKYFSVGPPPGAIPNGRWTNDTDIYVTPAGYNLIIILVGVFIVECHLSFKKPANKPNEN